MTIALLAHDSKKELMCQFCNAYRDVLSRHKLIATSATARQIANSTGLTVVDYMPGAGGGVEQITSAISYGEVDVVLMFRDSDRTVEDIHETELLKSCDKNAIPYATNMITGEVIIRSLDRGDLDWLEYEHKKNNFII